MKRNIKIFAILTALLALFIGVLLAAHAYQTRPSEKESSEIYDNTYTAYVDEIYSGSKLLVDVKLGFGVELDNLPVQLNHIYVSDPGVDGGDRARRFAETQVLDKNVIIVVYGQSDNGRWLIDVVYDNKDLAKELINRNFGEYR